MNFKYGGWTAPYFHEADEAAGEFMQKNLEISDLLLGKKTYEIFAAYWPEHEDMWPGINDVTKYVVSKNQLELTWKNSELISGDHIARIKEIKAGNGSILKVIGSGNLAQTLFNMTWLMNSGL